MVRVYNDALKAEVVLEITAVDAPTAAFTRLIVQKQDTDEKWQHAFEQAGTTADEVAVKLRDIYVANGETYSYKVMYINEENIIVKQEELTVVSQFGGLVVADKTATYISVGNWDYAHSRTTSVNYIQPFQRRYPIAIVNGDVSYESGNASGIFAPFDAKGNPTYENLTAYRHKFLRYLSQPGTKLFKTFDGYMWMVSIGSGTKDTYEKSSETIAVSFDWTEVDDVPTVDCLQVVSG